MNIFITLDYELYLGPKTGTVENCLIRPMNELCAIADKYGFKYIIFVDATYLLRMEQLSSKFSAVKSQYETVKKHIMSLSKQGHDIQLHFHPQWLYSEWDDKRKQWKMDRSHYKLSDLKIHEAIKSLREAKLLLDTIVGQKTIAYRAGGFCLDSFSEYKEVFKELGLKYDSSVARNMFVSSPIHSYDYRVVPEDQIYRFNDSIKRIDDHGEFIELSISSFSWNSILYFTRVRPLRNSKKPTVIYKDGEAISDGKTSLFSWIINLLKPKTYLASIDGLWSNLLNEYYDNTRRKGLDCMVLIGHPKSSNDLTAFNLGKFVSCHNDIVIKTFKDVV